jgi:hypothetical protein
MTNDVKVVQSLINQCIGYIVPRIDLKTSGKCDALTIDAIADFQRRVVKLPMADGRVDPGGRTLDALLTCAAGKKYIPKTTLAPTGNDGKKYTSNPNEVTTTRTTPPIPEVISVLLKSWPDLNESGARTLTAQFMAETTDGVNCYNWNLGNVKASANEPHMYFRNVWECFSQAGAEQAVQGGGGLVHIADSAEVKQHGWVCPAATVVFQPPHAQCRFRAYGNLVDGAQRWIGLHQRIANKNAAYLRALNSGDTAGAAHALKQARYYTASEASYAAALRDKKAKVDRAFGA